jgi:hypothetical protein
MHDKAGNMMPRNFGFLFCILFVFIGSAAAGEWWEETSFAEWSVGQVNTMLSNSPWAVLTPAAAPVQSGYYNSAYVPFYYQVRLLTARPIREGMLRLISLGMGSSTIDVSELNQGDAAVENDRDRLQEFIQSHPNDVRVKGDEQRIILAVTLKKAIWGSSPFITTRTPRYFQELTNADSLSKIDPSKIKADTSLAANNGKRVALLSYVPPGPDQLGVKFYFPRYLPDGKPLIKAGTKELLFKTRINNTKIKVKFDLRKMLYRGKLEV